MKWAATQPLLIQAQPQTVLEPQTVVIEPTSSSTILIASLGAILISVASGFFTFYLQRSVLNGDRRISEIESAIAESRRAVQEVKEGQLRAEAELALNYVRHEDWLLAINRSERRQERMAAQIQDIYVLVEGLKGRL